MASAQGISVPVPEPVVLVMMGVSGSGKSTVAMLHSERLGWPLEEGDTLHPEANVAKMAAGHPLTDDDRWPWLEKVAEWIDARLDAGASGVITCSALERSYRDLIDRRGRGVRFVYLSAAKGTVADRMVGRADGRMPSADLSCSVLAKHRVEV